MGRHRPTSPPPWVCSSSRSRACSTTSRKRSARRCSAFKPAGSPLLVNVVAVAAAAVLAFVLIGRLGVFGACLGLLIANLVRATGAVIAIAWLIADERSRVPARSAAAVSPAPIDKALGAPAEQ